MFLNQEVTYVDMKTRDTDHQPVLKHQDDPHLQAQDQHILNLAKFLVMQGSKKTVLYILNHMEEKTKHQSLQEIITLVRWLKGEQASQLRI